VQLVSRILGHGEGRHLGARGKGSDVVAARADREWISRPLLVAGEDIQHEKNSSERTTIPRPNSRIAREIQQLETKINRSDPEQARKMGNTNVIQN
jgi:hypothetical protein